MFPDLLRSHRRRRDLTQAELAELMTVGEDSVSVSAVSMWERGDRRFPLGLLERLYDALGLDPAERDYADRLYLGRGDAE